MMAMGPVEIIATIFIVLGVVKMIGIMISPNGWLNFAKKIYAKPAAIKTIAFVLSLVVLYYLIQGGMTIVQILAAAGFVALLIVVGMATYVKDLMKSVKLKDVMRSQWLYIIYWVVLLIWGIVVLFG